MDIIHADEEQLSNRTDIPFHLIVAVWGDEFVDIFVNIALPSLMSDNNVPVLTSRPRSVFYIYTTPEDEPCLIQSAAFKYLSQVMKVTISHITVSKTNIHASLSDCHRTAIEEAEKEDAALVFLPSDAVWSDGSISSLSRIFNEGYKTIFVSGVRTIRETMPHELGKYKHKGGRTIQISSRDLSQLTLNHLHPTSKEHYWKAGKGVGLLSPGLFWDVKDEGILLRCFHLHPLLVFNSVKGVKFKTTIDGDFIRAACPVFAEHYTVTDSDELLGIEMSPLSHIIWGLGRKESIKDVVRWTISQADFIHRRLVQHTVRLHTKDIDPETWGPVEKEADEVVNKILLAVKIREFFLVRFIAFIGTKIRAIPGSPAWNKIFGIWPETTILHWHRLWSRRLLSTIDKILQDPNAHVLWLYSRHDAETDILRWIANKYQNVQFMPLENTQYEPEGTQSGIKQKFDIAIVDFPSDQETAKEILDKVNNILGNTKHVFWGEEILKPWAKNAMPTPLFKLPATVFFTEWNLLIYTSQDMNFVRIFSRAINETRKSISALLGSNSIIGEIVYIALLLPMPLVNLISWAWDKRLKFSSDNGSPDAPH